MTVTEALDWLSLCAKSQVCDVSPRQAAELAELLVSLVSVDPDTLAATARAAKRADERSLELEVKLLAADHTNENLLKLLRACHAEMEAMFDAQTTSRQHSLRDFLDKQERILVALKAK